MKFLFYIFLFIGFGLNAQNSNRIPSLIEVDLHKGITFNVIDEYERIDTIILNVTDSNIQVIFYIFLWEYDENMYAYKENIYNVTDTSVILLSSKEVKRNHRYEYDFYRINGSWNVFRETRMIHNNYNKVFDSSFFNDSFEFYVPIKDSINSGGLFVYRHYYSEYSAYLYLYNKSGQLEFREKVIGIGESYEFSEVKPIFRRGDRYSFFIYLTDPSGWPSFYFLTM